MILNNAAQFTVTVSQILDCESINGKETQMLRTTH